MIGLMDLTADESWMLVDIAELRLVCFLEIPRSWGVFGPILQGPHYFWMYPPKGNLHVRPDRPLFNLERAALEGLIAKKLVTHGQHLHQVMPTPDAVQLVRWLQESD